MFIPYSDQIWTRLYGPYGVQDVASILSGLRKVWDKAIAEDLFWEKLHHQDDLYPVTFAALPLLWQFTNDRSDPDVNTLTFFSHVLHCATASWGTGCDGEGPRGKYRGLSLIIQDHMWEWIPEAQRLRLEDMNTLASLEAWFSRMAPKISEACLDAVSQNERYLAAMLSTGFATLHGSENLANAMTLWADEHELKFIREEVSLSQSDIAVSKILSTRLQYRNVELSKFLIEIAKSGFET